MFIVFFDISKIVLTWNSVIKERLFYLRVILEKIHPACLTPPPLKRKESLFGLPMTCSGNPSEGPFDTTNDMVIIDS
jgi:hypothetical protein